MKRHEPIASAIKKCVKLPRSARFITLCLVMALAAVRCSQPADDPAHPWITSPRNYTEVGKLMDSLKAPYVIDVAEGEKRLVFIGCEHQQDSTHEQFRIIEHYYKVMKPEVAFNEGGSIPKRQTYESPFMAIRVDGETGLNKYYADKNGIDLLNGDTPDSLEFFINAKRNDPKKLFVYYVIERLAIPYKYGAYENIPFEDLYNKYAPNWFKNYPLTETEKKFENFKLYYKNYTHSNFLLTEKHSNYQKDSLDIEAFDYVNDSCEFCEIGRSSKTLRDSILVSKLKTAFETKNRVLVTFGHGHAIALEPVLRNIFKQSPLNPH